MKTLEDVFRVNEHAAAALDKLVSIMERSLSGSSSGSSGGGSSGGGGPGVLGVLGKVAGIATAVVGALTGIVFAAKHFVAALNPSLVALFDYNLRNLTATIGSALAPIIANAVPIIQQLATIALELSNALAPIIDELSDAFGSVFIAAVRSYAQILLVVVNLFKPLADLLAILLNTYAQLIEVQTAFVKALIDTIGEFINSFFSLSDITDALSSFKDWLTRVAGVLAQFAGRLLVLFGLTDFLGKLKANLKKTIDEKLHPAGGLVAAPQNTTTGGIEDIAKRFAERAFAATAAGAPRATEVDLLKSILDNLDDASKHPLDWRKIIADAIRDARSAVAPETAHALATVTDDSATTSERFRAGRAAGGFLGGAAAVSLGWDRDLLAGAKKLWPF